MLDRDRGLWLRGDVAAAINSPLDWVGVVEAVGPAASLDDAGTSGDMGIRRRQNTRRVSRSLDIDIY